MQMEEINAAFELKVRAGMLNPITRHFADPNTAEDRMQDGLTLTWGMYHNYAIEKGVTLDDPIWVHACLQSVFDLRRQIVRASGTH